MGGADVKIYLDCIYRCGESPVSGCICLNVRECAKGSCAFYKSKSKYRIDADGVTRRKEG